MNNKKIKNMTRKQFETKSYTIVDILNIYADCVEYKVLTLGGYTKYVRVFD